MRIRLVAISIIALLCVQAHAESTPTWLQVSTPHFTVISDANEKQARHVADQFERMQAVFHRILPGAKSDLASPIFVLAAKNRRDFQALLPADRIGKGSLDLAGLFMQGSDRNYILLRLDAEGEHPFSTVYHEYTHYITREARLPVWLNEGIAEFYQNTDIDAHEIRFGQPSAADLELLRSKTLVPLPTIFDVGYDSPYYHDEEKGSMFYSESWALTYMLYLSDFTKKTTFVSNYLKALDAGQTSLTAAVSAFGDLGKLQNALKDELNQSSFKYLSLKMDTPNNEASYKVEALTPADANAYRADILVCNNRMDDAQKVIDSVLAANPNSALAYESEGLLHLRQNDIEGARKAYAQSAALHSTSFLAWYYAGVLNMRHSINENPEIEADLQQSLKLNPNFAPANDALAGYYTATHKNLDDALRLSLTAVSAEPDNFHYRLNNANLHMVRNEIPSALSVLEAARPLAHNPAEIAELNARIEDIHRFEDRASAASAVPSGSVSTVSFSTHNADGKPSAVLPVNAATDDPHYPDGPPSGAHHTARGVLHNVQCSYPTVLTLTVDGGKHPVALYTNNMYKISYTAGNFVPKDALNPCKLDGMKAAVSYTEVTDPRVAGQIVAIEVDK
ncbi:MAG TPA: tetratricopeptide repeat protein [Acidobacteriaceae bacterium]|nr:tetratricopeptide repeat protein [Acidobacteriaceae bacterium]